jgi:hypothetical protein
LQEDLFALAHPLIPNALLICFPPPSLGLSFFCFVFLFAFPSHIPPGDPLLVWAEQSQTPCQEPLNPIKVSLLNSPNVFRGASRNRRSSFPASGGEEGKGEAFSNKKKLINTLVTKTLSHRSCANPFCKKKAVCCSSLYYYHQLLLSLLPIFFPPNQSIQTYLLYLLYRPPLCSPTRTIYNTFHCFPSSHRPAFFEPPSIPILRSIRLLPNVSRFGFL